MLLRARNVLDKSCKANKKHILCSATFLRKFAAYENVEKCAGDCGATNDVTTWHIRV
jgi:hypothetical protein